MTQHQDIKTWQQRIEPGQIDPILAGHYVVAAMLSEIDELRAALAADSQQVAVPPEDTVGNRRAISENPGSAIAIMQRMMRRITELEAAPQPPQGDKP